MFRIRQFVLSAATVNELTGSTRLREIDLMRVKGKDQPVAGFEALGYHTEDSFPNLARALERYNEGLASYRARD